MTQVDTSPNSRVSGCFPFTQQSEGNGQSGLTGLPAPASSFIYRENGEEQDSVQSDRHLLFGVSIEQQQPLVGSSSVASLHSHALAKNKDPQSRFTGSNLLQGSFCPSATSDIPTINGIGLDENGIFQRSTSWPALSPAPPRTFTKVRLNTWVHYMMQIVAVLRRADSRCVPDSSEIVFLEEWISAAFSVWSCFCCSQFFCM